MPFSRRPLYSHLLVKLFRDPLHAQYAASRQLRSSNGLDCRRHDTETTTKMAIASNSDNMTVKMLGSLDSMTDTGVDVPTFLLVLFTTLSDNKLYRSAHDSLNGRSWQLAYCILAFYRSIYVTHRRGRRLSCHALGTCRPEDRVWQCTQTRSQARVQMEL